MSQIPSGPFGYDSSVRYGEQASSRALLTFFNAVYGWMAAGLALTALTAWWVSTQPQLMVHFKHGPVLWVLFLAVIGLAIVIGSATQRIGATAATALFLLFSALIGLMLSGIFLVYAHAAIASAFTISAGMFAAMSLWGMITRRDLSGMGHFLFMALIGLILAMVVSYFWASSTLMWIINCGGVLLFVGLTAYDTQRLKTVALATAGDAEVAARYSVNGALTLYLDFINLFLFMLRIMGNRRN